MGNGSFADVLRPPGLVVTPNFTESVAESVDYGKYMRFDFPHNNIKGAYGTANHH